jgi:hypothetical protein
VSGGTITAVSAGSAIITVTTQDGNKTATCSVTVSEDIITPADLAARLASLSANTVFSPHTIKLKVTSDEEFAIIKTALNGASNRYVNLDLSSSTINIIPNFAFNSGVSPYTGYANLTGVTIPNGVTSIGIVAFRSCTNLASIAIPDIRKIAGLS